MFEQWIARLREWSAAKVGIELTAEQAAQFCLYGDLLLEWNQKMNLTSITDPDDIVLKHFIDSLTVRRYLRGKKMADIGTGAGFPGIPLKIVQPDLQLFLVDSLRKRLDFLQEVVQRLGLKEVEIIHARAEELGRNRKYRAGFEIVTSRAVARLSVLLEYAIPLLQVNGQFIAMKGSNADAEIAEAREALLQLNAEVETVKRLSLGAGAEYRTLVLIRKIAPTSEKYPRKPGIPAKNPL
ncbi:MAG TPA: 16S rRNA (guanine(527)-N(7))-methyltransferase RsmG [Desulfitobacteriaceae bacterium]|nr:16S rRNA (guanine(527)-N(7))-methyltransferase RsmG [Desulfitobacteriaceae bacterium]